MKRIRPVGWLILLVLYALLGANAQFASQAASPEPEYTRIVVLSDLHLPGDNLVAKEKVAAAINSWSDLNMVVCLGDLCETTGSPAEMDTVKGFLSKITKPYYLIPGNHDFIYEDALKNGTTLVKASPDVRKAKLERFKKIYGLTDLYYSKRVGPYLLLFLATDDIYNSYLTSISDEQQRWLAEQLKNNRDLPTIIFFHGPLEGTLVGKNSVNSLSFMDFVAQPRMALKELLATNPQVFLWVAGHDHIAPTNAAFDNPANLYQNQIYNLHNPDLKGSGYISEQETGSRRHETLWANSLYLYPDRVQIRTYEFTDNRWLTEHDRVIRPNQKKQ